jgi:hypothetical protein
MIRGSREIRVIRGSREIREIRGYNRHFSRKKGTAPFFDKKRGQPTFSIAAPGGNLNLP